MTTLRQAAQQALAAIIELECSSSTAMGDRMAREAKQALRQALKDEQQDEPSEHPFSGLPPVIAGAIFDFAGFLTTRPNTIEVGSTANAAPMADLVKEWAERRGLSLDDAAVLSWQELLHTHPQPAQQPLTVTADAYDRLEALCQSQAKRIMDLEDSIQQPSQQPLTDEQIELNWQFLHDEEGNPPDQHDFARAIERSHGIGSKE